MGFSVIPLRQRAKEPLIPWQEFQKRIASEEEIRSWFTANADANVGIVTGEVSGLAVVDLDGPSGLASGKALSLTSAVSVRTGNGMQLYFRDSGTVRNTVRTYPGLDMRGSGGYVVAPPSIHPNGKAYQWLSSPLARHLLASFPTSLLTGAVASPEPRNEKGWIAEALASMRQGNIDDTLFKICSRLRADGFLREDAKALIEPHALRAGATPGHLDDKIANVWRRYAPNEKVSVQLERDGKAEAITEFLQDKQEVEWICHPFIAKKSIGFVAGLPKTLKTWLLVDLAVAMTANAPWVGLYATAAGRVLFIDQERFKGETQRRFSAVLAEKGLLSCAPTNLFVKCGTDIKLNDDRSFELFRQELQDLKPDLVIVDSFATFHSVPENNRMEIQIVLNRIKQLRDEIGCSFCFVNHEGKGVFQDTETGAAPSAYRMLGSVGVVAAAEFVLTVRKMADGSSLVHHTASTLAEANKSFYVNVVDTARGIAVKGTA